MKKGNAVLLQFRYTS